MDFRKVERASRDIASICGVGTAFTDHLRHMMRTVREVVSCDSINVGTIDLETEQGFHLDLDGFLMPPTQRNGLPLFKHQHPMLEYSRQHGWNPPLRFTDFLTRRQFEETGLYRECYRGYTHSMLTFGVFSPPGLNTSFVLSRQQRDFSEVDTQMLALLQPVISVTYERLLLESALASRLATQQAVGIIIGSGKHLVTIDAEARRLIQVFFPVQSLHRVPEQLLRANLSQCLQARPLAMHENGAQLIGSLEPNQNEWTLKVWEENAPLPAPRLAALGLSSRQVEVLQWIARGKTCMETAMILKISHRTVQKHLENIYRILGVETRLAAIAYCHTVFPNTRAYHTHTPM